MPSPELREWVDQVKTGTDSGAIIWRQANPTTYTWDTSSAKVVVQRVERMENYRLTNGQTATRKVVQYLLQVFDLTRPSIPAIAVNGTEDPEANPMLEKLFDVITNAATRDNLNFLKSLLPKS